MHTENVNSLEVSMQSNEKKPYSQPMLVEYGALNDVTESLHSFANSVIAIAILG